MDEAKIGDGLITVVGKVDPAKIRERVLKKTRKRVEVVSPQANKNGDGKEKGKGKGKENGGGGNGNAKEEKKELNDKSGSKKSDVKKEVLFSIEIKLFFLLLFLFFRSLPQIAVFLIVRLLY